MPTLLTVDMGTTHFKVTMFDHEGRLLHLHRATPPIRRTQPHQCELATDDFLATLRQGISHLAAKHAEGLSDVVAISFATQANSFVLLDGNDRPLTPLILWPDERAADAPTTSALADFSRQEFFFARTGVPELNHQFMIAKLRWLQHHQPHIWRAAARLCQISDYLTLWMTGQHITDASVAALAGLIDTQRLRWWQPALSIAEIPDRWLPSIVRSATDLGPIRPVIAQQLGLPETCRFVVGCLDQYAGAIGVHATTPEIVCETTGTVLAAVRLINTPPPPSPAHVFFGPAHTPDSYFTMSFSNTSANLLDWYRSQLSVPMSFEQLTQSAEAEPADCAGLTIEPYSGVGPIERAFQHVQPSHRPGQVVRATMQTVAQALKKQVEALSPTGMPREIHSAGGAAGNALWRSIKADTLGIPVLASSCPEPTSMGAAVLAGAAMGYGSVEDLSGRWWRPAAE